MSSSSLADSVEDLNENTDENEEVSAEQLKYLFDDRAKRFTAENSDNVIHELTKVKWSSEPDTLQHLTHPIVSLVYGRLIELTDEIILTGNPLSNNRMVCMDECLDFITRILQTTYETYDDDDEEEDEEEEDEETEANEEKDDESKKLEELVVSIQDKLCREIVPLHDSFLKLINSSGWKIMEGHLSTMATLTEFLIERHELNKELLNYYKNDELSLLKLSDDNRRLFNAFVECINSPEGTHDTLEAISLLDSSSLNERHEFLLFSSVNYVIKNDLYTEEFRAQFARDYWLPKYKAILKEILPTATNPTEETIHETPLYLNAIKYLITNLIQTQRTAESGYMLSKGQIDNFSLREEYLPLFQMLLPWFSNPYIVEHLRKPKKKAKTGMFRLETNTLDNTKNVTIDFATLTILKFIIMFITANGDCLAYAKQEKSLKEILSNLLGQVKSNIFIKLSIYNILGLLLDEKDIQSENNDSKGVISLLLNYIHKPDEDTENLSDLSALLTTLKAYLQYDQLKAEFIQKKGMELLIDIAMERPDWAQIVSNVPLENDKPIDIFQILNNHDIPKGLRQEYAKHERTAEEVQQLALECCFTMSFNNDAANLLRKNESFMNYLQSLAEGKTKTMIPGLTKAADSVLWKLKKEDEFKKEQSDTTSTDKDSFDLMISYSWGDKPLVRQIYKTLTEKYKFRLWFDENEMSGSLCQSMAKAVEKSRIILMCMSETYKKSENCRNEAEYARDRKKPIIPLKLRAVELEDWLGFIAAGKMYIDFGTKDFEKSMKLLKAEIERHQKTMQPNETVAKVEAVKAPALESAAVSSTAAATNSGARPDVISTEYRKISVESWSEQQVQDFIFDKKLDIMSLLTENMDGEEFYDLWYRCQKQQDCWAMFDRLDRELEKRHSKTLPISTYVRFLHQVPKYCNTSSLF